MRHSSRLASIDCFRGFAVLGMVLVSYLFGTKALPAWLRYAPAHRAVTSPSLIFLHLGLSSGRKVSQMRHGTI